MPAGPRELKEAACWTSWYRRQRRRADLQWSRQRGLTCETVFGAGSPSGSGVGTRCGRASATMRWRSSANSWPRPPSCSPSRSRSGTNRARRGHRVRRGPGGGAWPTPGPCSTRRTVGGLSPPKGRTTPWAAAARYNPTWPRTRSRPVLHGAVPAPPTALRPRRRLRHHTLEQHPQLVWHQPLNDPHHDQQPTREHQMR